MGGPDLAGVPVACFVLSVLDTSHRVASLTTVGFLVLWHVSAWILRGSSDLVGRLFGKESEDVL